MFLRIFKHLLPNARAWRITIDKPLRRFFEGLTHLGVDVKEFADLVWLDIFPDTTREIAKWEDQFGLPNTLTVEQERRDRLDATWKALGGQSPRYIQDALQNAGFNVYVHEWWQLPVVPHEIMVDGGLDAQDGDPLALDGSTGTGPVPHDPRVYLDDGFLGDSLLMVDGVADAQDGDIAVAMDGATSRPVGYPLVNKVTISAGSAFGDGNAEAQDGDPLAMDGGGDVVYVPKQYIIPDDPLTWPYFLYIGGETFPDTAVVPGARRNEFETLCLKICPTQQWLGMLIKYN